MVSNVEGFNQTHQNLTPNHFFAAEKVVVGARYAQIHEWVQIWPGLAPFVARNGFGTKLPNPFLDPL